MNTVIRTQISEEITIAATSEKFSIRETDFAKDQNTVKIFTKEEARLLAAALLDWANA